MTFIVINYIDPVVNSNMPRDSEEYQIVLFGLIGLLIMSVFVFIAFNFIFAFVYSLINKWIKKG